MKEDFIRALQNNSLAALEGIPKSDLHNHAGRGGRPAYFEQALGVKLPRLTTPLGSVPEMDKWFNDHIKCHFPDKNGWIHRLAAAFIQAQADNVTVLVQSYSVDEVDFMGGMDIFAAVIDGLHRAFAPDTLFLPDLSVFSPTHLSKLDEIFAAGWFKGIDIINYWDALTMDEMKTMCRKAREHGLIAKAHVGEFGGADDVMRYAEELALDQIQHGIAAVESPQIMGWLARHKVQLNVCPTSNILLGNAQSYATHPIRTLFDYGVPVTINSDDLLIFDATVSQEYLNLYNAGLMTAEELDFIRETGLSSCAANPEEEIIHAK
jgi:adenosine deaminase